VARTLFTTNLYSIVGSDSALSVGAKLYFFEEDGVTPATTYTTVDGSTENANPMLTQGDGRFAQQAWLEPGTYVYVLAAPDSSPADPLIDGTLVAPSLPESIDPDLNDFLEGNEPLPIANGGTGASSASDALINLAALPLAGGTVTGNIVRQTKGVHLFWNSASLDHGAVYLTVDSDDDPTSSPGDIWLKYA
jgi:hypothetical protein